MCEMIFPARFSQRFIASGQAAPSGQSVHSTFSLLPCHGLWISLGRGMCSLLQNDMLVLFVVVRERI